MIFSLPKLMALAGVIWAVWMGFKYLERRKGGDEGADSGGDQAEKGHRALDLEAVSYTHLTLPTITGE